MGKLTKNQIMLIAGVVILFIIYMVFFRKKPAAKTTTTKSTENESSYSSIPGTTPFEETFMQPTPVKDARASVLDAITV